MPFEKPLPVVVEAEPFALTPYVYVDPLVLTADLKRRWLAALRGGQYRQTHGYLEDEGSFCVLGVLGHIVGFQSCNLSYLCVDDGFVDERYVFLPEPVQDSLVDMNDSERATFAELADWIEANVEVSNAPV